MACVCSQTSPSNGKLKVECVEGKRLIDFVKGHDNLVDDLQEAAFGFGLDGNGKAIFVHGVGKGGLVEITAAIFEFEGAFGWVKRKLSGEAGLAIGVEGKRVDPSQGQTAGHIQMKFAFQRGKDTFAKDVALFEIQFNSTVCVGVHV